MEVKGEEEEAERLLQFVILWQLARKCSRLFDCSGGGGGLGVKNERDKREP